MVDRLASIARVVIRGQLAALAIVLPVPVNADSAPAKGRSISQPEALASLFAGRTLVVSTRYGDVPMRFSRDGGVAADAPASAFPGLSLAADQGRWWVSQQKICVQWQNWMEGRPHCFAIEIANASTLYWRADNGEEGIARFGGSGPGHR